VTILLLASESLHLYLSFFHSSRAPRSLPSFPTRRSSDLVRLRSSPRAFCAIRTSASVVRTVGIKRIVRATARLMRSAGTHEGARSEEHTSELQSRENLVCRLLLEKKKKNKNIDKRE